MLMAENGDILVIEASNRQILRVDPATGVEQRGVPARGHLVSHRSRSRSGRKADRGGSAGEPGRPGAGHAGRDLAGRRRGRNPGRGVDEHHVQEPSHRRGPVGRRHPGRRPRARGRRRGGLPRAYEDLPASNCAPCVPPNCPPDDPDLRRPFTGPNGVAVDDHDPLDPTTYDTVLVADYSTGELVRLDPDGGNPDLLSSSFNGPYVVAVVPELSPRDHDEFLISDAGTDDVYRRRRRHQLAHLDPHPGGPISEPRAMAFADPSDTPQDGTIFVIDGPDTILRVDIAGGVQTGGQTVVGAVKISAISATSPSSGTAGSSSPTATRRGDPRRPDAAARKPDGPHRARWESRPLWSSTATGASSSPTATPSATALPRTIRACSA